MPKSPQLPTTAAGWVERIRGLESAKMEAERHAAALTSERGDLVLDGTDDALKAHRAKVLEARLVVEEHADAITAAERRREECARREEEARLEAKRAELKPLIAERIEIARRIDAALSALDADTLALRENARTIAQLKEPGVHEIAAQTLISKRWFPSAVAATAPNLAAELDIYVNPIRRMTLETGQLGLMSSSAVPETARLDGVPIDDAPETDRLDELHAPEEAAA